MAPDDQKIDTDATTSINRSWATSLGILLGGFILTLVSLALALGWIEAGPRVYGYGAAIGWVGTVFFGLVVFLLVRQLTAVRGAIVTLSPDGLWDARISKNPVPWYDVADISMFSAKSAKSVVLTLHPGAVEKIEFSGAGSFARKANAALGGGDYWVAVAGLKVGFDRLLELVIAYAQAHQTPRAS